MGDLKKTYECINTQVDAVIVIDSEGLSESAKQTIQKVWGDTYTICTSQEPSNWRENKPIFESENSSDLEASIAPLLIVGTPCVLIYNRFIKKKTPEDIAKQELRQKQSDFREISFWYKRDFNDAGIPNWVKKGIIEYISEQLADIFKDSWLDIWKFDLLGLVKMLWGFSFKIKNEGTKEVEAKKELENILIYGNSKLGINKNFLVNVKEDKTNLDKILELTKDIIQMIEESTQES